MERPKLRPVEAVPMGEQDGQPMFLLRDPEHFSDHALTVSLPALSVIQLMDGQATLEEIQETFLRQFGQVLPAAELESLVANLDDLFLLDSERFRARRGEVEAEFRAAPVRQPVSAGGAYPATKDACDAYLRELFTAEGRPGLPRTGEKAPDLVGLIAPHIDTGRGAEGYAAAYKELAERTDAETFVLLGTVHQPVDELFIATRKTFATPLGRTEVDGELLDAIAAAYGADLTVGELAHRNEHSLEFQVLLLQYVLADRPHRIVPILCNSPIAATLGEGVPGDRPAITAMAAAIREAVEKTGRGACFVAGADLAHIGPQFGDERAVDEAVLADSRDRDLEMLRKATDIDADGFYRYVAAEQDRRRICGLGPIDALLRAMDADRARILHYGQWADPNGTGSVSFASIGYYRGEEANTP